MSTNESNGKKTKTAQWAEGPVDMNQNWDSMDYKLICLPTQITEALRGILDRYLEDAKRDFESQPEKARKDHVYRKLFLIRAWLFMPRGLEFPIGGPTLSTSQTRSFKTKL